MKIAMDYDGTFTRDPILWRGFMAQAIAYGHDVRMVTMRYPEEEVPNVGVLVLYTYGESKLRYLAAMNWVPDVWIDDEPMRIFQGREPAA